MKHHSLRYNGGQGYHENLKSFPSSLPCLKLQKHGKKNLAPSKIVTPNQGTSAKTLVSPHFVCSLQQMPIFFLKSFSQLISTVYYLYLSNVL